MDINAVLATKDKARFEIKGPFNVTVGLVTVNEQWVQLFVPKEKSVFRFPYSEFYKDNLRRDRFLNLLPIKIESEIFFDSLMTLIVLNDDSVKEAMPCRYDAKLNAYIIKTISKQRTRVYLVDPTTFSPLELYYFKTWSPNIRELEIAADRADYSVRFEKRMGEGFSTFPTRVLFNNGDKDVMTLHWKKAEAWVSPSEDIFIWSPPASIKIEHF